MARLIMDKDALRVRRVCPPSHVVTGLLQMGTPGFESKTSPRVQRIGPRFVAGPLVSTVDLDSVRRMDLDDPGLAVACLEVVDSPQMTLNALGAVVLLFALGCVRDSGGDAMPRSPFKPA
jgi:hypothetical protein